LQPVGVTKNYVDTQALEVEANFTIGELFDSLNLPAGINAIAIIDGKRMQGNEPFTDEAVVKIVSLVLGG
jgi:hypothetical protein